MNGAAAAAREALERLVVDVPDFPEPGVVFKDISPLLGDHEGFTAVIEALAATGRDRGWPTVLKASSSRSWRLLSRTSLPTPEQECRAAVDDNIQLPYTFRVYGRSTGYAVRIVERDGAWTVRRSRR